MREEFQITRQGKLYVLYAGLLDEATTAGLKSIKVEYLKYEFDDKKEPLYAVAQATVVMEDGREFVEIGDATRGNVGRNIQPHVFRMAATRAKARALRDAVNVGAAALEELGDEETQGPVDNQQGKPQQQRQQQPRQRQQQQRQSQQRQQPKEGDDSNRGPRIKDATLERLQKGIWKLYGEEGGVDRFEKEVLKGRVRLPDLSEEKAQSAMRWVAKELKTPKNEPEPEPEPETEEAEDDIEFDESDFDDIDIDNVPGVAKGGASE